MVEREERENMIGEKFSNRDLVKPLNWIAESTRPLAFHAFGLTNFLKFRQQKYFHLKCFVL